LGAQHPATVSAESPVLRISSPKKALRLSTRDRLAAKSAEPIDDANDRHSDDNDKQRKRPARARRKRLTHKERRRLIAKAMLMGVSRIVVT
jgi:hypothetical protein